MLSSLENDRLIRSFADDDKSFGKEFFAHFADKLRHLAGDNLLIIDDVPDAVEFGECMGFLPNDWKWLLTSNASLGNIETLQPNLLTMQEAKELFKKIKPISEQEDGALDELIQKLGFHAISIELTARVAKEANEDIATLSKALDERGFLLNEDLDYDVTTGIDRGAKSATLINHIQHILFDIKEPTKILKNQKSLEILKYIAFLPKSFSTDDMTEWLTFMSLSKKELRETLKTMQNYGFMSKRQNDEGKEAWYCCASIQNGISARLDVRFDELMGLIENFIVLSDNDSQNKDYKRWLYNVDSVEKIVQNFERQDNNFGHNESSKFAILLSCAGVKYKTQGDVKKAMSYYEKALKIDLNTIIKIDKEVAVHYNNLGVAYLSQESYDDAISCFDKAIEIDLNTVGEQDKQTGAHYNNLGLAYFSKGNYHIAISHYEKALQITMLTLQENHPSVAIRYNNIGLLYRSKGEYEISVWHHEKALAIALETVGQNNPDIAIYHNNLASAYYSKSEYNKAIQHHEKAYKIAKDILGDNHPNTMQFNENLQKAITKQ